ncbi:MAG TPA: YbaY family lipoprotein, partial [Steroidobacteraceae bacterium]|nr:YbaY family lipoprotein [Steroidobacteraceae bacterium]
YDPAAVDASRRYAVSARVLLDDDVLMSSSAPEPVLTRGAPESVTLELKAAPPADAGGPKVEVVVTGDLQMGDSSARYRAVVVDDEVASIEEEFSLGDYGSGVSRFWFEGARVVRYEEDSKKRLIDPARPEELVAVETRIEFDDSGALVAGEKRVGGEAVEVTPTDLSSVRNRADLLRSRALAQHAGTVHTSPHQPASNP